MKRPKLEFIILLRKFCLLLLLSALTTFASYAIVTARNVPMRRDYVAHGTTSLTGEYLVTLPCDVPGYESDQPLLPEARGIPFNFNYYTPCEGNVMLAYGFALDFTFWTLVYVSTYAGLVLYRRVHDLVKK